MILEVGETKNDDARTVYLDDELKETLDKLWKNRKRNGILIPNVFPNENGNGPIVNFRKAWNAACRKAWDMAIKLKNAMSRNGKADCRLGQSCMISGAPQ